MLLQLCSLQWPVCLDFCTTLYISPGYRPLLISKVQVRRQRANLVWITPELPTGQKSD
jgi:hypothetical protein